MKGRGRCSSGLCATSRREQDRTAFDGWDPAAAQDMKPAANEGGTP